MNLNPATGVLKNVAQINAGGGFTKSLPGTFTLAGTNTYTGNTTVTQGTLLIGSPNAIPNGTGTGTLVLDGGTTAGVLDLHGSDATVNGLSGATGAVLSQVTNNGAGLNTLTFGNANANASFSGTVLDGTGQVALNKIGSGTETLAGANTYSGTTTVSAGILRIGSDTALGSATGGTVVLSGGTLESLTVRNIGGEALTLSGAGASPKASMARFIGGEAVPQALTSSGSVTLNANSLIKCDGGAFVNLSGPVSLNANALSVTLDGSAASTLGGTITGNGATSLNKNSTSTLILSGPNSYTGATNINGGVLQANNAQALGSAGNIAFAGGTLQYTAASAGSDWSARLKNTTAGGIKLDSNGQSITFAGSIDNSNTAGLTLADTSASPGTLVLSGFRTVSSAERRSPRERSAFLPMAILATAPAA